MAPTATVGVLMGSDSDLPTMAETVKILEGYGVAAEVRVLSAHRTPEEATRYAREAEGRGLKVLIAGAGGAAHLAGALAAHSTLPVIGVPLESLAAERVRRAALHRPDAAGDPGGHGGGRARWARATPATSRSPSSPWPTTRCGAR